MSEFEGEMDITTMKVADLKKELRRRGLSAEGKKQELIERLLLDDSRNKSGGEEFLGEEEADSLLKEEDEPLSHEKTSLDGEEVLQVEPPKKKVAINRDISIPTATASAASNEINGSEKDSPSIAEKGALATNTASAMTDLEKSQARKERFGIETGPTAEERKAARAARFGLQSTPSVDMDKLKQRTERFGQVNSSTIKKMEDAERIKKRQERFGVVTSDVPLKKVSTGVLDPANEEKLKKRAERFGIPSSKDDDEKKKMRSMRFGVTAS